MSGKEHLSGRKRRSSKEQDGTRAALYLRVSTAEQRPDLQHDGLSAYATRAGLEIIQDLLRRGGVRPPGGPPSAQCPDDGGQKP